MEIFRAILSTVGWKADQAVNIIASPTYITMTFGISSLDGTKKHLQFVEVGDDPVNIETYSRIPHVKLLCAFSSHRSMVIAKPHCITDYDVSSSAHVLRYLVEWASLNVHMPTKSASFWIF